MGRVVFEGAWQQFFGKFGLKSFDDFFMFSGGRIINKNHKRDVRVLTLGENGDGKVFFMKRFYNVHFKDIFFTFHNLGRFCSQGRYEWENAKLLLSNGIETYKPVCCSEQNRFGFEQKSFFITEQIQGRCFTDFIAENWARLAQTQKENLIVSLGKTIRKIHASHINFPDLYAWHIFIKKAENNKNGDNWEFAFIDLHRMTRNVTNKNQLLQNLGRLDHSMLDKYFDESIRRVLIESYAGQNWPGGIDRLARKVKRFSDAVSAKRNPKQY